VAGFGSARYSVLAAWIGTQVVRLRVDHDRSLNLRRARLPEGRGLGHRGSIGATPRSVLDRTV